MNLFFDVVNVGCILWLLWWVFAEGPRLRSRVRELESALEAERRRWFR